MEYSKYLINFELVKLGAECLVLTTLRFGFWIRV